jgi:hypothetical protein
LVNQNNLTPYTKIPQKDFAELRINFQSLSKKEQDAFFMAQLLNTRGGKPITLPIILYSKL